MEPEKRDDTDWTRFQELLDEEAWPSVYTFKFIAPEAQLDALTSLFGNHSVRVRSSSKGNYVSVTARIRMDSSDEVLAIYEAASEIDDVILL